MILNPYQCYNFFDLKGPRMKKAFFIIPFLLTLSLHSFGATLYAGMKTIPSANDSFFMGFSSDSTKGPDAVLWGPYACCVGKHLVKFTYNFYIDSTMVTQADFQALMGFNPSGHTGNGLLPVESLTWYDAALYCNARSKRDNLDTVYKFTSITKSGQSCNGLGNLSYDIKKSGYRIPTNAEYEYATRAHTPGAWFFSTILAWTQADDKAITASAAAYCWNSSNSGGNTNPVAKLKPNAFGLYDMRGNCFEWENDFEAPYPLTTQTDPVGAASGAQNTASCGNSGSDASSKMCCGASFQDDVCNHERTVEHYHWSATARDKQIAFRCSATTGTVGILGSANMPTDFQFSKIVSSPLLTNIEYRLEKQGSVTIAIFNCKGNVVRTLFSGRQAAGKYVATWDGKNGSEKKVGAGSYIVSVQAGQRSNSKTIFMAD
jgi:formylglycine-generating enzyme required for sulfatase activity